jgi:serine/threonine-protein kinase
MESDSNSSFATADGIAVGTIDYMSPEQACGKDVDGRSDLYSLGCSMHHLITGQLPFPGDSPVERLGSRINGKPVPVDQLANNVPPGLVGVMARLLANRPGERYQTAQEAAEALEDLLPELEGSSTFRGTKRVPAKGLNGDGPSGIGQSLVVDPAAPEREYVEVRPAYPGWFSPRAELAETSPWGAFTVMMLVLFTVFAGGFFTSILMRQ